MKKLRFKVLNCVCGVLCAVIIISSAFILSGNSYNGNSESGELQVINIWQIDYFEGGKGSRAEYLRSLGEDFAEENNVYIEVTTLGSEAAKANIQKGVWPDIISYGSGMTGLEGIINTDYPVKVWCRGGYCLLSLTSDDFSGADGGNTVINSGKDNLISAAALLCGLQNADYHQPTAAYVKLINGDYKYLLGTQRDIVRLQTKGVNFYVYPLTVFNDLYQNISVVASGKKGDICNSFIGYILNNSEKLTSICMFSDGIKLYDGVQGEMEGLSFVYTVPSVVGDTWKEEVSAAIKEQNTDMLKSLLK